jgi:hypothetical protein
MSHSGDAFRRVTTPGLTWPAVKRQPVESQQPLKSANSICDFLMAASPNFDNATLEVVANHTIPGTSASYPLFKEGTNQLYAVGETSNTTGCSTPT